MENELQDKPTNDDLTIPARPRPDASPRKEPLLQPEEPVITSSMPDAPPFLQRFFTNQANLNTDLAARFPSMPLLPIIRFKAGEGDQPGSAAAFSPDETAALMIEVGSRSGALQFTYSYGSMLALHFRLEDLSPMDRERWFELMRQEKGGVAFMWGQTRWEKDFLICVTQGQYTSMYAFSKYQFGAAVRLTSDTAASLLDWLEKNWTLDKPDEEPPRTLSW